jgi:hypothetical protein
MGRQHLELGRKVPKRRGLPPEARGYDQPAAPHHDDAGVVVRVRRDALVTAYQIRREVPAQRDEARVPIEQFPVRVE